MGLDIRIPLGLIFLLIGGLMSLYGLFTRNTADIYEKSMGINLNLTWGAIMFVFGLIMFLVGRRQILAAFLQFRLQPPMVRHIMEGDTDPQWDAIGIE